ncbi:MAG: protein translocase subunit SecE [Paracoccaceae bacterium]|nr:MAG: preprotein translocase subunit SecE [Alphaproteobacteria bacterium]GIX13040.1 MAG: protein translocase subunit SecE [Paracoccaceae bacterium]
MARANPFQFVQQVRAEAAKIAWPSRRETVTTTIIVFVMSVAFALFFFIVDQLIALGLEGILSMAS